MSELITAILKRKLDDLAVYGRVDAETRRNALKEELQLHILNFIYRNPEYSDWIMYGGSALRIIHGLDRMSVDLDFEVPRPVTEKFLKELKMNVENHFFNTYGAGADFLTVKIVARRGVLLKFHVDGDLGFEHPSKQVHVKIDLNHFVAPRAVAERRPINRDQLSFVITTYNMAALMASKIAAIFLRGNRGVGKAVYSEKGRDIYDLLWYMNRKVVPDLNYLISKGIDVKDPLALFDKLTLQMRKVSDENLKNDLFPLFVNRNFIANWLKNWRESYTRLLDAYEIRTVGDLDHIDICQDFRSDSLSFAYLYKTGDGKSIGIVYAMSNDWLDYVSADLRIKVDDTLDGKIKILGVDGRKGDAILEKIIPYATLFYRKSEKYLNENHRAIFGDRIATKLIRMTADNFNPKEQIILNRSSLLSCGLEGLVK